MRYNDDVNEMQFNNECVCELYVYALVIYRHQYGTISDTDSTHKYKYGMERITQLFQSYVHEYSLQEIICLMAEDAHTQNEEKHYSECFHLFYLV